jgi:L-alanine-DL-glutamate epimerase-like enolase superfamily enzyme
LDKKRGPTTSKLEQIACSLSIATDDIQIEEVRAYPVSIPFRSIEEGGISPFVSSQATTTSAKKTLIRITCGDGITGWGEIPTKLPPGIVVSLIEEELAGRVVGMSALYPEEVFNRTCFTIGRDRIETSLFAAGLEAACWDAVGQALETPVSDLLGGKTRSSIPTCFYMGIMSDAEATALAQWGVENGFQAVKLKIGLDLRADERRIRACRASGGETLEIRVDANQSMSRDRALHFLQSIESLKLQYIEQPLPIGEYEDLRILRSLVNTPIAVNEDCFVPGGLEHAIRADAIDAAVVELDSSGISGLMKLAELADRASIRLAHHCAFDLGLKTAAVLQTTSTRSVFSYEMDTVYPFLVDDILEHPLCIRDGKFIVPDGPRTDDLRGITEDSRLRWSGLRTGDGTVQLLQVVRRRP